MSKIAHHFFCEQEWYEELKEDIMAYLKNEKGAVTFAVNEKWFGSTTTPKPVETKEQALDILAKMYNGEQEFLRKIHREGVEVHSCFWDSSLNSIIKIEPGELPEPKRVVRKKKSSKKG